jgi:hypothetical protein
VSSKTKDGKQVDTRAIRLQPSEDEMAAYRTNPGPSKAKIRNDFDTLMKTLK